MLFHSLAASALLFASAVFARPAQKQSGLEVRQTTTGADCPASGLHIIAVSGEGATGSNDYGLLINLTTSIQNAIPGTTNVSVPYNRNATNKLIGTTQGSVNFTSYVNQFHAACPCTKVAVIGYSSGAIISMNAICGASAPWTSPATGFDASYADYIVAVIAYGDETRTASAPYDLGTCHGNGRFPRTPENAACPVFADRIQSYCDVTDPECCLGTVNATHYVYDLEYDGDSTQFIKSKFEAAPPVCSSTTTTAAPSTTPPPTATASGVTVVWVTDRITELTTVFVTPSAAASDPPAANTAYAEAAAATTAAAVVSTKSECSMVLEDDWQYPHLIVPVNSASPDTAYGTVYDGKVSSTVSSIFNFDVPSGYAGKTCTAFFSLPLQSELQWSSYTTSGSPGVSFGLLSSPATEQTTYSNKPSVATTFGDFTMTPGSSFVVHSGACAAGDRLSYIMSATGDYALTYFQAYGEHPIGLYMSAC